MATYIDNGDGGVYYAASGEASPSNDVTNPNTCFAIGSLGSFGSLPVTASSPNYVLDVATPEYGVISCFCLRRHVCPTGTQNGAVTLNSASDEAYGICVRAEVAGLANAAPSVVQTNEGSSATPSVNITAPGAGIIIVALDLNATQSGMGFGVPAGFTTIVTEDTWGNWVGWIGYKVVTASGANNAVWNTMAAAADWTAFALFYADAATGVTVEAELPTVTVNAPEASAVGYKTVTLAAPISTAPGSVVLQILYQGGSPQPGDVIHYPDTDGLVIFPDGTFVVNVDNGTYSCSYFDGTTTTAFTLTVVDYALAYTGVDTVSVNAVEYGPTIFATAIASTTAFGTASLIHISVPIIPTGIASGEAFGTLSLVGRIVPAGIASVEIFGSHVLTRPINATGIPSGEAFGVTAVFAGGIASVGIPSAEAMGAPALGHSGTLIIASFGIPSGEAFGAVEIRHTGVVIPSIVNVSAFGAAALTGPFPVPGIPSAEAFGLPSFRKDVVILTPVELIGDGNY